MRMPSSAILPQSCGTLPIPQITLRLQTLHVKFVISNDFLPRKFMTLMLQRCGQTGETLRLLFEGLTRWGPPMMQP